MKNNYTVAFIMLSVASIAGGMALDTIFEYSPLIGWSLGGVFIICAVYFAVKSTKD